MTARPVSCETRISDTDFEDASVRMTVRWRAVNTKGPLRTALITALPRLVIGQDVRVTDGSGEPLGRFVREDIRAVLANFGISHARRAADTDSTEEAILL